jgi:Flp pilus assembly protein TadD
MLERRQGRHAEAIAAYRRYLALVPGDPEPLFGLGLSLQATGQITEARSTFERFVHEAKAPALAPFVERARAALANMPASPLPTGPPPATTSAESCEAVMKAASYEEAQICLTRVINLAPTDVAALYDLAFVERQLRHHAAAVRAFRAYINLSPNDPDPYYGLAAVLAASGDRSAAADALRAYLRLENRPSEARWVARAQRRLRALEGRSIPPSSPTVSGGAPGGAGL